VNSESDQILHTILFLMDLAFPLFLQEDSFLVSAIFIWRLNFPLIQNQCRANLLGPKFPRRNRSAITRVSLLTLMRL